jgi:hypothetical protein
VKCVFMLVIQENDGCAFVNSVEIRFVTGCHDMLTTMQ